MQRAFGNETMSPAQAFHCFHPKEAIIVSEIDKRPNAM